MTDNEIIKALECCGKNHILGKMSECKDCYLRNNTSCITELIYHTLDLINRQKAEIKNLTSGKCVYLSDDETTEYCVEGPCPNYKTEAQIKAEAYKEFAERLKANFEPFNSPLLINRIDNLLKELEGGTDAS